MELKDVIDGYFALTGRPVATMTVEEYISFLSLAQTGTGTGVTVSYITKEPAETVPTPETVSETEDFNTFARKTESKEKRKAPAQTEKTMQAVQTNVMAMMRSVKG